MAGLTRMGSGVGSWTRTLYFTERREPGDRESLSRARTAGRLLHAHQNHRTLGENKPRSKWSDVEIPRLLQPGLSKSSAHSQSRPEILDGGRFGSRIHLGEPAETWGLGDGENCWATGGVRKPQSAEALFRLRAKGWETEAMAAYGRPSTAQPPHDWKTKLVTLRSIRPSTLHQAPPLGQRGL